MAFRNDIFNPVLVSWDKFQESARKAPDVEAVPTLIAFDEKGQVHVWPKPGSAFLGWYRTPEPSPQQELRIEPATAAGRRRQNPGGGFRLTSGY